MSYAMVLHAPHEPLTRVERAPPVPAANELLLRVEACGVCRTDLHLVDGELPQARYPVVPGHEVVGIVESAGDGVTGFPIGARVGVPWLASTCGTCRYCLAGRENLCDRVQFTGCHRDGGYATHMVAIADYCLPLASIRDDPAAIAPLLCAGLIGWRTLQAARPVERLGVYGFGAAAHIVAQVASRQGTRVFAFTRPGDAATQAFAHAMGACWSGGSDDAAPEELDAAILFAPAGELVPIALANVRKGGRVVCGGIHMSDIPRFPYRLLWGERELVSVANLTRDDGHSFLAHAAASGIETQVRRYPLSRANDALRDLRAGRHVGALVLVPD